MSLSILCYTNYYAKHSVYCVNCTQSTDPLGSPVNRGCDKNSQHWRGLCRFFFFCDKNKKKRHALSPLIARLREVGVRCDEKVPLYCYIYIFYFIIFFFSNQEEKIVTIYHGVDTQQVSSRKSSQNLSRRPKNLSRGKIICHGAEYQIVTNTSRGVDKSQFVGLQ